MFAAMFAKEMAVHEKQDDRTVQKKKYEEN